MLLIAGPTSFSSGVHGPPQHQRTPAMASKLQEQAESKGELSYSGWVKNMPANSPDPQPVKLTPEEAARLQQQQQQQQQDGTGGQQQKASAWNAAGTFEEKTLPDGRELLVAALVGVSAASSSGSASITQCKVLSGDAHVWFIRGKKRHGFEFECELTWQWRSSGSGSVDVEPVTGSMKLPSASPDELDGDLHIQDIKLDKASGDAAADSAALAAAGGLKQQLEQALESYYETLRNR